MASQTEDQRPEQLSDEVLLRHRWRYREAKRMGMTPRDAKAFAHSDIDIGEMRTMLQNGCTPDQMFSILL